MNKTSFMLWCGTARVRATYSFGISPRLGHIAMRAYYRDDRYTSRHFLKA